ncbi:sensor histidine kinase [Actinomadura sp. 6N118]|uniref:sensor histidine kinase n=1 Tax=Actinomadura sp. 6N118 TaxID=3375151 RepID=UPI0037A53C66
MKESAKALAAYRFIATHPRAVDIAIAFGATVFMLLMWLGEPLPAGVGTTALVFGLVLAQSVPLVWRRSRPWTVMVAIGLAYMTCELIDPSNDALSVLLACYAVARYSEAPKSAGAIAGMALTVLTPDAVGPWLRSQPVPEPIAIEEAVPAVVLSAATWLLGAYQRRIHADAARLRSLAGRLSAEQEVSARRAVAAERARIARDMHDLVAHHVSAIALQARATTAILPDDPGLAGAGVAGIGKAADTALVEMRGLLRLLADDQEASGPRPEPSLRHLDQLVQEATAVGSRIEVTMDASIEDAVDAVPRGVQVSAYRVIQEALTNIGKHTGPTQVRISLRQDAGRLTVTIENGPPAPGHTPMPGSGLGLIGMRERTALFDGELRAGPSGNGGWRVVATFQLTEPS